MVANCLVQPPRNDVAAAHPQHPATILQPARNLTATIRNLPATMEAATTATSP